MKHEGLIIGLLAVAVVCSVAGFALNVADLQHPTATVAATGTAQKTFIPDIARIDLGVQTDATVVQKAQQDNAVTMKGVIAALKAAGIKDNDIQTSSFWVNQNYEYSSGQSVPAGWRVSNSVTVTTTPAMVSSLIDAASRAGANIFNSITFDVSNREALKAGLMKEAVANARAKAQGTLEGTTHSLGDMQMIEADWSGPSVVYPSAGAGGADTGSAAVESGTNMLSVSVSVRFRLK
jgi:hypothetical protein